MRMARRLSLAHDGPELGEPAPTRLNVSRCGPGVNCGGGSGGAGGASATPGGLPLGPVPFTCAGEVALLLLRLAGSGGKGDGGSGGGDGGGGGGAC